MIKTQKFVRKPVTVDAVRVTKGNFEELAKWCHGEIRENPKGKGSSRKRYIHVRVHNPKNDRQKMAYVGDWILYTDRGYKVYTNSALRAQFDLAEGFADMVAEARERQSHELKPDETLSAAEKQLLTEDEVREQAGLTPVDRGTINTVDELAVLSPDEYAEKVLPSPTEEGAEVTSDGWQPGDVREDVFEGSAMAEAIATIEDEGGTVEEATPEGIADVVKTQEQLREAAEAAGKRVISEEEQEQMDPDEIKALLQSGDVILARDLAAS